MSMIEIFYDYSNPNINYNSEICTLPYNSAKFYDEKHAINWLIGEFVTTGLIKNWEDNGNFLFGNTPIDIRRIFKYHYKLDELIKKLNEIEYLTIHMDRTEVMKETSLAYSEIDKFEKVMQNIYKIQEEINKKLERIDEKLKDLNKN